VIDVKRTLEILPEHFRLIFLNHRSREFREAGANPALPRNCLRVIQRARAFWG
jgi:hypothetical protein